MIQVFGFKGKSPVEKHSIMGGIWLIGWLFTVGYLHLAFWSGVFAIFIWPYFIGANVSGF